ATLLSDTINAIARMVCGAVDGQTYVRYRAGRGGCTRRACQGGDGDDGAKRAKCTVQFTLQVMCTVDAATNGPIPTIWQGRVRNFDKRAQRSGLPIGEWNNRYYASG